MNKDVLWAALWVVLIGLSAATLWAEGTPFPVICRAMWLYFCIVKLGQLIFPQGEGDEG